MTIQLHVASPALKQDWYRLWKAYLAFYETTLDESVYASSWARILSESDQLYAMLAYDGETAVGLVNYLYHPSFWEEGDRCYLNDLYVDQNTRKGGVGRMLIDAVVQKSNADGIKNVYWTTAHGNAPARALYDKVARLTPFIKYEIVE